VEVAVAKLRRLELVLERVEARRQAGSVLVIELDAEQGARIARDERPALSFQLRVLLREVEDELVHDFDGGRPVAQDERRGGERLEQRRELDRHHRFRLRQRHQPDRRFEDDAERALRPDHQPRQIERPIGHGKLVQVVAADAAQQLRIAALDLAAAVRRQPSYDPAAARLE
jgi:hypothetical protein